MDSYNEKTSTADTNANAEKGQSPPEVASPTKGWRARDRIAGSRLWAPVTHPSLHSPGAQNTMQDKNLQVMSWDEVARQIVRASNIHVSEPGQGVYVSFAVGIKSDSSESE